MSVNKINKYLWMLLIVMLLVLTSSASIIADASPTITEIIPPSASAGTNSDYSGNNGILDYVIQQTETQAQIFKSNHPTIECIDPAFLNTDSFFTNMVGVYNEIGIPNDCDDLTYWNIVLWQKYGYTFVNHAPNADDQITAVKGKIAASYHAWNIVRCVGNNTAAVNGYQYWFEWETPNSDWFSPHAYMSLNLLYDCMEWDWRQIELADEWSNN